MEGIGQVLLLLKETLGPWPTAAIVVGTLAIPVIAIIALFAGNLRIGPLAIELRKAAIQLDELSVAMAESRIAELEVAARQVVTTLSDADKKLLRQHIETLKATILKVRRRT